MGKSGMNLMALAFFIIAVKSWCEVVNLIQSKNVCRQVPPLPSNQGIAKAGWVQAKNACRAKGMRLLSLESAEENNAVIEAIVLMPGESFWIAGSDLGYGGNFYWETTGHYMGPFLNWAPDEPSNESGQHCVQMWSEANHLWDDTKCEYEHLYICESHLCTTY